MKSAFDPPSVTDAEYVEAHRANALFDAHRDDPEFGYRFLVTEAADAGRTMAERTAWRICSTNVWWSAFGKKRGKNSRPGPPAHDDRVDRDFPADAPNQLWLSDITEHRTGEGKLYVCAIKDVFSNRIVGSQHRLTDEVPAGDHRPQQCGSPPWRRRRLHPPHGQG